MATYYLVNENKQMQEFIADIKNLDFSFVQPNRNLRRNPDGPLVKNISKKKFPIFTEIERNKEVFKNDSILFLGFMWNSTHTLFDMERLLLPLYFSFYLQNPVYIYFKPRYFKIDYLNGVTKILDGKDIPNFTLTISRSSSLNSYNKLKNEKNIVITPVSTTKFPKADLVLPNNYLFKCPDPFLINNLNKYSKKKKNMILINGTLWDYKGQYKFLEQVNTKLIKDYVIVFLGVQRDHTFKQCIKLAQKRNISLICIPFIKHELIYKVISKCKYQISYCCKLGSSNGDPNPRSITEGLYAGLPFLVSDWVVLPRHIKNNNKIGIVCKNNDSIDLNNKLKQLLTLKNKDVMDFVKKNCNYNDICKNIIENILGKI